MIGVGVLAALLPDIGRGFREGAFMFWETLWPLILGFALSGAVQAFVPKEEMERRLGDHRPPAVARASLLGMISSSCSYAASAMAKSLFEKGADFLSAMTFMFASTNLVIELGIVLAVLLGWPFVAAEFVGGPIMIVLLVALGAAFISPAATAIARQRLRAASGAGAPAGQAALDQSPWKRKLASPAAWSDAASYTIADLKMLRRELVIGFVVAGFLATLVPIAWWNALFIHGHGVWTNLENALVGPIIAFLSFVCSIGNVPLAAALWKGGISFGGVVSFIFADLIAAPLVLIYRRYYGRALTVRLVGIFWLVMSTAGFVVGELFSAAGIAATRRPLVIVPTSFHWNATTALNVVFLVIFATLYILYRSRSRLGGGTGYAFDPVCGMQVRTDNAPAHHVHEGRTISFCSDRCAERFAADPERFTRGDAVPEPLPKEDEMAVDPVCHMEVEPATAAAIRNYEGRNYFFCATGCAEEFDTDPARYAAAAAAK